jgi:membrane protease YdiL (CAAX protease family)
MENFQLSAPMGNRKEELWEVLVFLFLILPSMVLSFFVIKAGNLSFTITAYSTILRDLGLVSLILFYLWRNQEPRSRIGWNFQRWGRETAWGLILFVPFFFVTNLLEKMLLSAGFSTPSEPLPSFFSIHGAGELGLAVLLVVIVALAEESIFRGYLILRLRAITRSPAIAVLLSSFIFSLGHGYEGSAGVVTVGAMGLIFALVYLWRQSLVAPMVMHFLQDFIGIVLAPLLGWK